MQALEFETRIDKDGTFICRSNSNTPMGNLPTWLSSAGTGNSPQKGRQPGSAKGILKVLSEDDEHLDDFREYMP